MIESRRVTVALYGGSQPSKILDPHVVKTHRIGQDVLEGERHSSKRPDRLAGCDLGIDLRPRDASTLAIHIRKACAHRRSRRFDHDALESPQQNSTHPI